MKSRLERYVGSIVQQTDCSGPDKEDLYEELLIHLQLSRDSLMEQGFSVKEAEIEAIRLFGDEQEIGSQLQHAMYPYRKEMVLTLAISSLIVAICTYILQLFWYGDAHIIWLVLAVASSSLLLYFSIQPSAKFQRRRWLNSILIAHLLLYLYGGLLAGDVINNHAWIIMLVLSNWAIIGLGIFLLYHISLFDFQMEPTLMKIKRLLHGLNITSGIVISAATLFFVFGGLIMIGYHPRILIFCIPLGIWIILYVIQMKLVNKGKKIIAFALSLIPIIISLAIVLFFFGGRFF